MLIDFVTEFIRSVPSAFVRVLFVRYVQRVVYLTLKSVVDTLNFKIQSSLSYCEKKK